MEFKSYTAQTLNQLIESDSFNNWENIPISKIRAQSQIVNPRAKQDDVVLICALENNKLAGYLGLLPDDIFLKGSSTHLAWLSCIWINNQFRGQKIAQKLIEKAEEYWGQNLLITGVVPQIEKIYFNSGVFDKAVELHGLKLFTGLDLQTWLPPKYPFLNKMKDFLTFLDLGLGFVQYVKIKKSTHPNSVQQVNGTNFDENLTAFINEQTQGSHFQRGAKEWLWMINNPWIKDAGIAEPKYYFSSAAKRFINLPFQVTNSEGEIIAFMLLTIRDKAMKIPVLYGYENAQNELLLTIAEVIKQYKIASFLTFQPSLVKSLENGDMSGLYKKPQTRKIFIGNAFDAKGFSDSQFQDGDGDLGFT